MVEPKRCSRAERTDQEDKEPWRKANQEKREYVESALKTERGKEIRTHSKKEEQGGETKKYDKD